YYRFLLETGQIETTPLAKHKALKISQKVQVPFSENEILNALSMLKSDNSFEGVRNRLIIELFYSCGIRRAELINVKLDNLSYSQHALKVLGKRNKERIIPLLPSVLNTLQEYIPYREKLKRIKDAEFLFLTNKGVKIYESLVYRIINSYFGSVSEKVKKSPHILRHS